MAVGLFAAAALAAALAGPQPARLAMDAPNLIVLRACNHTSNTIQIAVTYVPVAGGGWRNKGWTVVGAGACKDLFATVNHTFYARAEVVGHPERFWGKDINQCVVRPGPYDFITASQDIVCPQGAAAGFATFQWDGGNPVYTWNVPPL